MDLLIIGLPLLALAIFVYFSNRRNSERNAKLTERVQNLDIGEGVTLLEGIRARSGEDGFWVAAAGKIANVSVDEPLMSIIVREFREGGEAPRYEFEIHRGGEDMSAPEKRDEVFRDLVRAAKEQRARPAQEKG